jgi:hypothetical protein
MIVKRWRQGIKPVQSAKMQPQLSGRANVLKPKGDDGSPYIERRRHFIEDVAGGIRRRSEYHDDELSLAERIDDCFGPTFAGGNVAGGDPASYAGFLQAVTNRVCRRFVVLGVADENVMGHGIAPASLDTRTVI